MGERTVADRTAFDVALERLGFQVTGTSRKGGRVWSLPFNRHLTFAVHDDGSSHVVLSWALGLGEYLEERGWRLSVSDTSASELYPQHDVQIARDIEAVGAEMTRVLATLRIDLGAPDL
ncbi:MAG: hypothetical protein WD358_05220 [Nitriliruptoraceae bacterium]